MIEEAVTGTQIAAPAKKWTGDRVARLFLWPLLFVFVAVTVIFNLVFSASLIEGDSMLPTLHDGDRTLMTKGYSYAIRGDVVVADIGVDGAEDRILKRVVAVAGDTVEIIDDVATVNGVPESSAPLTLSPGRGENRPPLVVPEGHVYLMGDNRGVSLDSRFIGPVELERVYGRVVYVFWPLSYAGPIE